MRKIIQKCLGSLISLYLTTGSSYAIEINPGDYEQYPINSTIGILYYQHGENSNSYSNGKRIATNTNLDSNVGLIRALHVLEIAPGVTFDPQFILPVGALTAGGALEPLGSPGGMGDLILTAPFKFKLDTAYKDIFALTPWLILPTGSYLGNRNLNFGSNRYQGILQAAYIKHFDEKWSLDLIGDVSFYSDNTAAHISVPGSLKQDPQFELQAYLRYKITPTFEVAGGVGSRLGGNQTFRNVSQRNAQQTEYGRLAASYYIPEQQVQIQFEIGRDLHTENGLKQDTFVQLRLAKLFLAQ